MLRPAFHLLPIGQNAAIVGTLLVGLAQTPAFAEGDAGYSALWPVPKVALAPAEPESDVEEEALGPSQDSDSALFASEPMAEHLANLPTRAGRLPAGRAVPIAIIRQGLSANGTAAERAVGVKIGEDVFAVSTKLLAPPGEARGADARLEWKLGRPVAKTERGFIWSASAGGAGGTAALPEQNANLLVGFRQTLFQRLTVTPQLSMLGNYVFATGEKAHSTLVPEITMTADLSDLIDGPWQASFDLGLARQMPLVASAYETRGSAMLRLKYQLD